MMGKECIHVRECVGVKEILYKTHSVTEYREGEEVHKGGRWRYRI